MKVIKKMFRGVFCGGIVGFVLGYGIECILEYFKSYPTGLDDIEYYPVICGIIFMIVGITAGFSVSVMQLFSAVETE